MTGLRPDWTSRRPSTRVVAAIWAVTVLAAMTEAALTLVARGNLAHGDLASQLALAVSIVAYATLGALIVRRAGNLIGWLMLAAGAAQAFLTIASIYAVTGIATFPGSLPAARQVGTLAECAFPAVVFTVAFMFLLFPTGTLPSRRWRPVAAAGLALAALTTAGLVVHPRLVALIAPGGASLKYPNPLAAGDPGPVLRTVLVGTLNGLSAVFLPFLVATFVSLAVRYRTGGRLLRQQVKWLALTAVGFTVCLLVALLGLADGQAQLTTVAYTAVQLIALFGIPAAMAIAILVHRLYDIDVIISRTVVYGLLSAAATGVYAGIVLGIGTFVGHSSGPLLTIAAAVTIALLFQPLRHRAQRLANRLVYGQRATPYQALSDFAGDMAGQLDLTEAVDRMVSVLAGATGADRTEVWIRVGTELRLAATWPHGSPPSAAITIGADDSLPPFEEVSRAVAVRQGGELLGALCLQKPRNEPLTSTEDELMRHLASQAGLVLRNAALTAELRATIDDLRASRRRLVETQDAERQKIERNLHDGAQQQLIALTIHLALLEESADDPAAVRELVTTVKTGVHAALAELRDLARGIYPPLLADQGLVPALQAQARKAAVPVEIDADGIGRYPQDTEAAVYFCTLEALQNITKYASASRAKVGLSCSDDSLWFTVTDNGTGFDTTTTRYGTGLQGMADRLAALGGALQVRSQPGHGTILSGELPLVAPSHGLGRDVTGGSHAVGAVPGSRVAVSPVRYRSPHRSPPEGCMPYIVDFETVSTVGLESSPVAHALAGLRANEARYFRNKYDHVFTVSAASEAPEALDWVNRILADERDLVISARPLEVTSFEVDGIRMAYVFYESGLSINVMYTIQDQGKRAVGFKLSEGMEVPEELAAAGFKFARQKSKLAGVIRGSFFVIKGEY